MDNEFNLALLSNVLISDQFQGPITTIGLYYLGQTQGGYGEKPTWASLEAIGVPEKEINV